jgi:hypothetical protein
MCALIQRLDLLAQSLHLCFGLLKLMVHGCHSVSSPHVGCGRFPGCDMSRLAGLSL